METFCMSGKERRRLEAFSRVQRGELTLAKVAELLGLSYRQAKRSYRRYREQGDAGLTHGLRGRASNRRQAVTREQALALYRERYADFGPTLAAEQLAQEHQLSVATETLRQWLLAAGLWQRRRKRQKHRQRRPRKEHRGELLQLDGSHHDWFEGRRGWAVLMVAIDDATGQVDAQFFEEETTAAAMHTLWRYLERWGVPRALYVDQDSIYRSDRAPTPDEVLAEQEPRTQLGRALEELGVRLIRAHSPQAKGRVERCHGTLQDRLVKALRLRGLSDLAAANAFLEQEFLSDFNARFAVEPAVAADLHQPVPAERELALVFSLREQRSVQRDWTLRWHNRWLQIAAVHRELVLVGRQVTVCEHLDGTLCVLHGGQRLQWSEIPAPPPKPRPRRTGPTGSSQGQRPAADHPWRRRAVQEAATVGAAGSAAAR